MIKFVSSNWFAAKSVEQMRVEQSQFEQFTPTRWDNYDIFNCQLGFLNIQCTTLKLFSLFYGVLIFSSISGQFLIFVFFALDIKHKFQDLQTILEATLNQLTRNVTVSNGENYSVKIYFFLQNNSHLGMYLNLWLIVVLLTSYCTK
jgi:hypothetical protein